jgi:hypothetical protein
MPMGYDPATDGRIQVGKPQKGLLGCHVFTGTFI